MENKLRGYDIRIGKKKNTVFCGENGIYQDGTLPMCRDEKGTLWAMGGHTHVGHIGMFKGSKFADLQEVYPIHTNFKTGSAEYAFNGIKYPEGIAPRGSIWPMGLYICPKTHRFFCFFHNETGWNGEGSGYDSWGYCEKPRCDSDFRHVGLMYSDDEGKTWEFSRWILTAKDVCFCERFNPDGVNVIGQKKKLLSLGSGDFTLFVDKKGGYLYLLYNIITLEKDTGAAKSCDVYYARSRIRYDGLVGDFVKYYNGSFCEAGNLGKETPVVKDSWHAKIVYSPFLGEYILSSTKINGKAKDITNFVADYAEFRTGADLVTWSKPIRLRHEEGKEGYFGNHYITLVGRDKRSDGSLVSGGISALLCHNGTEISEYPLHLQKKAKRAKEK